MALTISTEIIINSTPQEIWTVLTNFKEYPKWNPFVKSLTGDVIIGNQIKVALPGMNFKPTVMEFKKDTEFRWLGHLWFKGLFDGEHSFKLVNNGNGTVTFIHSEVFNGILVSLFKKNLLTKIKGGFIQMNERLKTEVEQNL